MTALLHTWGSNLSFHPHLHCIVPGGGYGLSDGHWKNLPQVKDGRDSEPFLFPVKALSPMFRAKSPVCGVDKTLEYIARYAYRVAISNNRIKAVDDDGVTFEYKDYRDEGANKEMTLSGVEFVRRYSQHVLPERFVRIRHFGFLRFRQSWQARRSAEGTWRGTCPKASQTQVLADNLRC